MQTSYSTGFVFAVPTHGLCVQFSKHSQTFCLTSTAFKSFPPPGFPHGAHACRWKPSKQSYDEESILTVVELPNSSSKHCMLVCAGACASDIIHVSIPVHYTVQHMNNTPTSDHFPKLLHCMNTACHDLRDAVHVLDYVILHVEPHTPANGLNGRVHPPHHCQVLFLKNSSTSCSQTFLFPLLSRELEMIFALHLHTDYEAFSHCA